MKYAIIDPPPLGRWSPRAELVAWLEDLKTYEEDEHGGRDYYIKFTEKLIREHDELVAKGEIKE